MLLFVRINNIIIQLMDGLKKKTIYYTWTTILVAHTQVYNTKVHGYNWLVVTCYIIHETQAQTALQILINFDELIIQLKNKII